MARLGRSRPASAYLVKSKAAAGAEVTVPVTDTITWTDDATVSATAPGVDTITWGSEDAQVRTVGSDTLTLTESAQIAAKATESITWADDARVIVLGQDNLTWTDNGGFAELVGPSGEQLFWSDDARVIVLASEDMGFTDTAAPNIGIPKAASEDITWTESASVASSIFSAETITWAETAKVIVLAADSVTWFEKADLIVNGHIRADRVRLADKERRRQRVRPLERRIVIQAEDRTRRARPE
jgi:hypothetical protein